MPLLGRYWKFKISCGSAKSSAPSIVQSRIAPRKFWLPRLGGFLALPEVVEQIHFLLLPSIETLAPATDKALFGQQLA